MPPGWGVAEQLAAQAEDADREARGDGAMTRMVLLLGFEVFALGVLLGFALGIGAP